MFWSLQGMFVDLFSALASDDAKAAAGQFGRRPWGACFAAPGWGREWMGPDGVCQVCICWFSVFFCLKRLHHVVLAEELSSLIFFWSGVWVWFFQIFLRLWFWGCSEATSGWFGCGNASFWKSFRLEPGMFDLTSICTKRQRIVEGSMVSLSQTNGQSLEPSRYTLAAWAHRSVNCEVHGGDTTQIARWELLVVWLMNLLRLRYIDTNDGVLMSSECHFRCCNTLVISWTQSQQEFHQIQSSFHQTIISRVLFFRPLMLLIA